PPGLPDDAPAPVTARRETDLDPSRGSVARRSLPAAWSPPGAATLVAGDHWESPAACRRRPPRSGAARRLHGKRRPPGWLSCWAPCATPARHRTAASGFWA